MVRPGDIEAPHELRLVARLGPVQAPAVTRNRSVRVERVRTVELDRLARRHSGRCRETSDGGLVHDDMEIVVIDRLLVPGIVHDRELHRVPAGFGEGV